MSSKLIHSFPRGSDGPIRVRPSSELWNPGGLGPEFLESWFVRSYYEDEESPKKLNWGVLAGLSISVSVSVAFWVGIVFLVERVWK